MILTASGGSCNRGLVSSWRVKAGEIEGGAGRGKKEGR